MSSQAPVEQKLITVASGKGGVGKTWLSATLSHTLARNGHKVLLFDGDLGLANIDIQLGLMPEKDLGMVLTRKIPLEEAITPFVDESNRKTVFDVISGQSGSGALASLRQEPLGRLARDLRAISRNYDFTIMDLGAGVENSVTTLAQVSDKVIVVVTGDPTSLTDAYAFIKVTRMRNPEAPVAIVVNMVKDRHVATRIYETLKKACENFLKFTPEFLGPVRQDDHVVSAIRHQQPLLSRHPVCAAGEDVEAISRKL